MTTNFRNAYSYSDARPLYAGTLAVGDTLIQAIWNYNPAQWREIKWTVTKVLNSRIQVERTYAFKPGETRTIVNRVLVTNSKSYTYRNGEVETTLEGESSSWRRDAFYLFTTDDEVLVRLRAAVSADAKSETIRVAAMHAAEVASTKRSLDVESATAAIAALQAYVGHMNTKETE